ncbi:MAG: hypothetical protein VX090_01770, partial [Pseudomonadota bacterium]|nr:hypothetical protein [Pseudomonadota bacterium]
MVLDKVREAFSQIKQIHVGGEFNVTMSGGVAMVRFFEYVPSMTGNAHQALYEAKAKGQEASGSRLTSDRRHAHCRRLITP